MIQNLLIHNSGGTASTQPEFALATGLTTVPADGNGSPNPAYRAPNFWFRIEDINSSVGGPGETGPQGPQGPAGGGSNGAMSVSFYNSLKVLPTKWGSGQEPPGANSVANVQNYTLINDTIGTTQNLNLTQFEFLQVGALGNNVPQGGSGSGDAGWPNVPHDAYGNAGIPTVNGTTWSGNNGGNTLGPPNTNRNHNNFYGYRIPYDGVLLGFSIDFCEKANNGLFNVFYWDPQGSCVFATGGPIIGQGNSTGYSSGNTVFSLRNEVQVKANGYLFAAQDLSYQTGGTNVGLVNSWFGGASGHTHITAYLKFNDT